MFCSCSLSAWREGLRLPLLSHTATPGEHTGGRFQRLLEQMNVQRGDDLEDDFVPDDLVASSGEEDATFDPHQPGDDIDGLLSADEDAENEEPAPKGKQTSAKRKRREKEKERQAKVIRTLSI